MTRMWNVPVDMMCRQHILGEHNELHQIVGTIRKHEHGEAIVEGHAKKLQMDTSIIQERHDELVEEMERRGWNHNSPMSYEDELDMGDVDVDANINELWEKCEDCRARMEDD